MSVSVDIVERYSDGFRLQLNNGDGGGRTIYIELNRERDFASDDTLFSIWPNIGAGVQQVTIVGLPSGTPFFVRARSDQGGGYANVLLAATLPVEPAPYAGFSIDKAMVVLPVEISNIAFTPYGSTTPLSGYPVSNLLRDDPGSTFQAVSTANDLAGYISFSTSGEPVDTIAILGSMAGDLATTRTIVHPTGAFGTPGGQAFPNEMISFRCSPTIGRRPQYHMLQRLPQPVTERFFAIDINAGGARHFIARNLVVGLARGTQNAARGNSEAPNDLGAAARTRFGVLDRVTGWRGRTVDFEMGWLSEAEYQTKWGPLMRQAGKTKSVLAIPNSKRNVFLNDRIAFGPITDQRGQTVAGRKLSFSMTIDSIY